MNSTTMDASIIKPLLDAGNSIERHEPRTITSSIRKTIKYSSAIGLMGLCYGACYGYLKNFNKIPLSTIYGMKWMVVGSVFFGSREAALHYRQFANKQLNVPPHISRNRDAFSASVSAGIITGATMSAMTSGSWAIIPGAITYGIFSAIGEFVATILSRYRLQLALKYLEDPEYFKRSRNRELWEKRFDPAPKDASSERSFDMAEYLLGGFRDIVQDAYEIPAWMTPLFNAFDRDYKDKLLYKIDILENQIQILEKQIHH